MRLIAFLLAVALSASAYAEFPKIWQPPFSNAVAAQVGGSIITTDDLRRELAGLSNELKAKKATPEQYDQAMERASRDILAAMVEQRLLIEEFKAKGYKVPSFQLDNEYQRILKERFEGKLSELVGALAAQGKTLPEFRKEIEESLMADAMRARFRRQLLAITPEQVQAFYETHQADFASEATVHLKVLLLAPMADEPKEVLAQTAEEVKTKIAGGLSFDEAIEQFSQDKVNNDWGLIKISDLSPELQAAVKNLQAGEISAPIPSPEGDKILLAKVLERQNEQIPSLEEVRGQIENRLRAQNGVQAYKKMIEELKAKTYVKISLE